MKNIGLLIAVLVVLSGQVTAPAPGSVRHLVYQFGYNTKVAKSGDGTGTTTIDILGPAADGGVMINGTDYWWNTARPRATNTCELHPNGGVSCSARPYAISPMQLTIFPLLAKGFFKGLTAAGTGSFSHPYKVYAAIIPGAAGQPGTPNTWDCVYSYEGKGHAPHGEGLLLVVGSGTLNQEGGRYRNATSKQRILVDPRIKLPVFVSDVRTHFPQRSTYNNDLIELSLIQH